MFVHENALLQCLWALVRLTKAYLQNTVKNSFSESNKDIYVHLKLQSRQAILSPVSCEQVSSCFLLNWCMSILRAAGGQRQRWAESAQVCKHSVCLLCCNLNPSLLKVFVFPGKLHCSVTCITPR